MLTTPKTCNLSAFQQNVDGCHREQYFLRGNRYQDRPRGRQERILYSSMEKILGME